MLFHTNFENPLIAETQKKQLIEQNKAKNRVPPKPQPNKLQFTVRSILPKMEPKPDPQPIPPENEVRLLFNDDMTLTELQKERKREKRRK